MVTRIKCMPPTTADRTDSIQVTPHTYPVFITPSKAFTPSPVIIRSFGHLFHFQKCISADSFRTSIVYSRLGSGVWSRLVGCSLTELIRPVRLRSRQFQWHPCYSWLQTQRQTDRRSLITSFLIGRNQSLWAERERLICRSVVKPMFVTPAVFSLYVLSVFWLF